jgi:hypothetical protein
VEQVSVFLDHSSLAVTSVYLRRLEGQEDPELADGGGGAGSLRCTGHGLAWFIRRA